MCLERDQRPRFCVFALWFAIKLSHRTGCCSSQAWGSPQGVSEVLHASVNRPFISNWFSYSFFFSCCVYVCALVGVCACGHTYMHVHLEATSQPWLLFLRSYLAYFLQQGISLAWGSWLIQGGWPVSLGELCLSNHYTWPFNVSSSDGTQVVMFVWQIL